MRRSAIKSDMESGKWFLGVAAVFGAFAWFCTSEPLAAFLNPVTVFYGISGVAFLCRGQKW